MSEKFYPEKVFSYCPRCGSEKYHAQRKDLFICDNCDFCFHINAAAAVAGLLFDQTGRILFTKRAKEPGKGLLDLPGGFVDINETAEDALKREIFEELNIEIGQLNYLTTFPNQYPYKGFTYFTLDIAFTAIHPNFDKIKLSEEIDDYQLIFLNQLNEQDIAFDSIRHFIRFYSSQYLS
ncbi:MAG: NUDIX domain-containing protein [Spirochaetes bacterium]|nr:NUDIX domain-containing protein [Spirochaetota bacterium]